MKIGITGQVGFIGTHLKNFLTLQKGIEVVPFADDYFDDDRRLQNFVKNCDAIVHLQLSIDTHPLSIFMKKKLNLSKRMY